MKYLLPVLLLVLNCLALNGQNFAPPDTILTQTFTVDPSDTMLIFPSGNDTQWVNWDADNLPTQCGEDKPVPGAWYWESDLGDQNDPPINSAFTSCSHLSDPTMHNENWLITPPVFIPDSTTILYWRSLSFEGPGFLDGYKVLVSTTGNEPFVGAFTDTIFFAAEMEAILVSGGSLDPDDFLFSTGYVHANRYTDTAYFFHALPGEYSHRGRLEPHQVNLSAYVGKWIYIAFLHDSTDDNVLQIDDITVIQGVTSSSPPPRVAEYFLKINPNPTRASAQITWKFISREAGRLLLTNLLGEIVLEQQIERLDTGAFQLDMQQIPAGFYTCTLQTNSGQQTVLLVKQ